MFTTAVKAFYRLPLTPQQKALAIRPTNISLNRSIVMSHASGGASGFVSPIRSYDVHIYFSQDEHQVRYAQQLQERIKEIWRKHWTLLRMHQ